MTCTTCPKRNKCTELCAEAEKFVSQDNTPKAEYGRDIVYSLRFLASWTSTTIDFAEIEERKKDELIFYFQKIHDMDDSINKAILAMVYFEIPMGLISNYLHIPQRTLFDKIQRMSKIK